MFWCSCTWCSCHNCSRIACHYCMPECVAPCKPIAQEVPASDEEIASLLAEDGWLLTWDSKALASQQEHYNYLAVQACSNMRLSSVPSCPRTTKKVQLLDCNILWAAYPLQQVCKLLALQGLLLAGGGVTREEAQAAFGAAGADPDTAPLSSLQTVLRPLAAKHFFPHAVPPVSPAAKRQRV